MMKILVTVSPDILLYENCIPCYIAQAKVMKEKLISDSCSINRNPIVFSNQTEFQCVQYQSEDGKYNMIWVNLTGLRGTFLCMF